MGLFDFIKKGVANNNPTIIQNNQVVKQRIGKAYANKLEVDNAIVDKLFKMFIAFDVETTGLNPLTDRIVELGAVLFVNGTPVDSFSTLVNPKINISSAASAVNHITNTMLSTAPLEAEVYPRLLKFLGTAVEGEIICCAHNAKFDFDFLCSTLSRLGYDTRLCYVDTLGLSRKYIKGIANYKQSTVQEYFALSNKNAHRAASDAEICGKILCELLKFIKDNLDKQRKEAEKLAPNIDELEVCAYVQNIIEKNGGDIDWLRYKRNSSNYVEATYLYPFIKFKFTKKGKFIIVKNDAVEVIDVETEPCTVSEGGATYVRVYFDNPFELESFSQYIFNEYKDCRKSLLDYIGNGFYAKRKAEQSIELLKALSSSEVEDLVKVSEKLWDERSSDFERKEKKAVILEPIINREDVVINPIHNRVPLDKILNFDSWEKGYDAGSSYWYQGEKLRKADALEEAIQLFEKARYNGYNALALYDSYAKAYRQLKDYENEIVILEEGIDRKVTTDTGVFIARRDKAIKLLFFQQEAKRKILTKEKGEVKKESVPKIERNREKQATDAVKVSQCRPIIQLSNDHVIIKEFESLAAAIKETGINSKSIRDAANGVQKHAGGYCWKYKE